MYDKKFKRHITIGKGTKAAPEKIEGLTVQCKNGWVAGGLVVKQGKR